MNELIEAVVEAFTLNGASADRETPWRAVMLYIVMSLGVIAAAIWWFAR